MMQHNSLIVKLSGSQFPNLKSTTKNTGVTLELPPNMIGVDETNFQHK